jgi:hypothetical protein
MAISHNELRLHPGPQLHQLQICKISNTNTLINPPKKPATPYGIQVSPVLNRCGWLKKTHFQKYMHMHAQDVLRKVMECVV